MASFLLRPKWLVFHVAVAAAMVGMLAASSWQWGKYRDRDEFVTRVEVRQDREKTPPVALTALLGDDSLAEIEYRIVTAAGSYVPSGELQQINRSQGGASGVNVLTPFAIDGGPTVIVNRGFVPDGTQPPPPPDGPLVIGGTARLTQIRRTGELTDNEGGDPGEVRRVDLALIATRLDIEIAPVYVDLIASDPASPQPPLPVPPPVLTGGPPHLSYAIQWLVFTVCVAIGWAFAVRRSMRSARLAGAVAVAQDPPDDGVAAQDPVNDAVGHPARPSAGTARPRSG